MLGAKNGDFVFFIWIADEDLVGISIVIVKIVINGVKEVQVVFFIIDFEFLVEVLLIYIYVNVGVHLVTFKNRLWVARHSLPAKVTTTLPHLLSGVIT